MDVLPNQSYILICMYVSLSDSVYDALNFSLCRLITGLHMMCQNIEFGTILVLTFQYAADHALYIVPAVVYRHSI